MSDEEVIRRRLLIDGDGTGDDRRLNVLLKTLVKWCESPNDKPDESKTTLDRMLAQLAQCEFAVKKSQLAMNMMSSELKIYEQLSNVLESGIETAKTNIDKSKNDLKQAKIVRKNRIEYDVLAKVIMEQPDRKDTLERLDKLKSELKNLESTKQYLENRLNQRKKQFYVLVSSIHELQSMLDEGETDDVMNITEDVEMAEVE